MLNFRKLVKPGLGVVGSLGTGIAINYFVIKANEEKINSRTIKKAETAELSPQKQMNYYERNLQVLRKTYPTASDQFLEMVAKADVLGSGLDFFMKYLNSDLNLSDLNSYHATLLSIAIFGLGTTLLRKKPVLYNEQAFIRAWDKLKDSKNKIKSLEIMKNNKVNKIKNQDMKRGSRQNIELIEQQYSER